jgi:ABC-type phosphate transport system substrate-binding protein
MVGHSFFNSVLIITVFVAAPLLLFSDAGAEHKADPTLRGEAFTDPNKKFPMPEDWVNKPIKYEPWADKADISIALEQDVYQTILPLIKKYGKEKGLKIEVKEGTCGIAAGMLSRKTVDIGGFCCAAGHEDRLPGLRYHTLGVVSKTFFVNSSNPFDALTEDQLRNIYRGKIFKWSELKTRSGITGPDWTINTVGRLHCQKRPGHWRLLLDNDKLFSPRMIEVGSIPDMLFTVSRSREAIGWEVLSMVGKYDMDKKLKLLRINGYDPHDYKALAALRYPFYRVYNITTWEGPGVENAKAIKLVEYLIKEVENLDPARFGFVSPDLLKKAGWKFKGTELIGEPKKTISNE